MWDKNPQPREQQKEILAKYNFKCSSCGVDALAAFLFIRDDVRVPGRNEKVSGDNLVPLCGICAGGLITNVHQEQIQDILFAEWLRETRVD